MIVEYSRGYDEDIKDLFLELQTHIAKLDKEKYNIVTSEYREKYFEKTMQEIEKNLSYSLMDFLKNNAFSSSVTRIFFEVSKDLEYSAL